MNQDTISLIAVGDLIIDRDKPETIFAQVAPVLREGDISFAQLEQMYSDKGCPGTAQHGSTYSHPRLITALTYAGINVASLAGNHTMDFGGEALLDTIARLRQVGIAPVGAGKNLAEARKAAILDRNGTKIAFLSYCAIGPDGYEADTENPGYAPIRVSTLYERMEYQPGTPCRIITLADRDDLRTMVDDIKKAKSQADIVVLSIHWGWHNVPVLVAMYQQEIGHVAIDAGVDLILGHHAHILKGIEVYQGKVIFYSLANFAVEITPEKKTHSKPSWRALMRQLYNYEPDPSYTTYHFHPEAKTTTIAKVIISDKKIQKVSYLPTYVNPNSEPEIVTRQDKRGQEVFQYMSEITRKQGFNATFSWEGDEVLISAGADAAKPIGPQQLRFVIP